MGKAIILFLLVLVIIGWIIMTPGVFVVQPTPAYPDGLTLIYYSRSPNVPFFYSATAMCLGTLGVTDATCEESAVRSASDLFVRRLITLPYSEWAFERSIE
jgi:hypothetical protein